MIIQEPTWKDFVLFNIGQLVQCCLMMQVYFFWIQTVWMLILDKTFFPRSVISSNWKLRYFSSYFRGNTKLLQLLWINYLFILLSVIELSDWRLVSWNQKNVKFFIVEKFQLRYSKELEIAIFCTEMFWQEMLICSLFSQVKWVKKIHKSNFRVTFGFFHTNVSFTPNSPGPPTDP